MGDYGISKVLPNLNKEDVTKLLQNLKDFGVLDVSDLKDVSEEDLMKECGLKKLQARKLYQNWQKGHLLFFQLNALNG